MTGDEKNVAGNESNHLRSKPLQEYARSVEEMRQGIDLVIEQYTLPDVPSKLSKDGLANYMDDFLSLT